MRKICTILFACLLLTTVAYGQTAMVQFVHNSPDLDIASVDVYIDDVLTLDDFAFRGASTFTEFTAGTHHIIISPSSKVPADSIIAEFDAILSDGEKSILIIDGISDLNLGTGKYVELPGRVLNLLPFGVSPAQEAAIDPAKVELSIFHGATDAPLVDIVAGGVVVVDNINYGQATGYMPLDPGSVTFQITPAEDNETVVATYDVDLSALAGQAAVLMASGVLNPVANEGAKALALVAVYPDGQTETFEAILDLPIGPWTQVDAGGWTYDAIIDSVDGGHGVAVCRCNRIWNAGYYGGGIDVQNADGTPAAFSPINTLTVDGTDYDISDGNCRGMATDKDGNILYCKGDHLFRIDPMTGTGMDLWVGAGSLTAPSVDDEGFIYVGTVVDIAPISVIDPITFEEVQQIDLPGSASYARGIAVWPDGKTITAGDLGGSGGPIYLWTSEDLVNYTVTDSIYTDDQPELLFTAQRTTMDLDADGKLWVSHDNAYAAGDNSPNGFKVFDFETMEYFFLPSPEEIGIETGNGPRGITFTSSGDTAYTTSFNANVVWRYIREADAMVQLIHNAADLDVREVDVYANGGLLLAGFEFRKATPFLDMTPGTYDIVITPSGTAPEDSVIDTCEGIEFAAGQKYALIASGVSSENITAEKYVNPDPDNRDIQFTLFQIENAQTESMDPTMVELAVFHGATDVPAVDVMSSGLVLVDNVNYGQSSAGYVALLNAEYQLDVTPAEDNETIVASFDADLSGLAGQAAVVFASGFLNPEANEGGKALGLFAVLASGDVIELPRIIVLPPGPWQKVAVAWEYDGVFDPTTDQGHGIAVDRMNRVWAGCYGKVGIHVMYPDGTPTAFSPIDMITVDGTDYDIAGVGGCRGMCVDADGNILYAQNSKLFRINAETGEGMALWEGTGSLTAPSVDNEGFIYIGKVVGISPISVIDPSTFEEVQQIELEGTPSYGRGIAVWPDGATITCGDLGGNGGPLYLWTSEDLVTYTKTDSIYTNNDAEPIFTTQRTTMDFAPDEKLWVSHDNAYAAGDNTPNGFLVFDFETEEYSFLPGPQDPAALAKGNGPRGVAFSVTADTAYAICNNAHWVFRYVKKGSAVADLKPGVIPKEYELSQNYPNPFNPTTTINFALPQDGKVEIKVYDGLGRLVAELLDKEMKAGRYAAKFDAGDMATGAYYYRIKVNDNVMTKKMMLVK